MPYHFERSRDCANAMDFSYPCNFRISSKSDEFQSNFGIYMYGLWLQTKQMSFVKSKWMSCNPVENNTQMANDRNSIQLAKNDGTTLRHTLFLALCQWKKVTKSFSCSFLWLWLYLCRCLPVYVQRNGIMFKNNQKRLC